MSTWVLTASDARALGMIIAIARHCPRVRRLMGHAVVEGTARGLVRSPEQPVPPGPSDDVRGCWLWVTGTDGLEHYWPVMDLVADWQMYMFTAQA